ncbi:hypothetical protein ACJMK2_025778 [Sinanodonta woodiana]|uniref:Uncharacterized protein n=1 Tax=Sinanodonta woodiana TaxID=1069815 RepID=A0ABD3XJ26_SINWO
MRCRACQKVIVTESENTEDVVEENEGNEAFKCCHKKVTSEHFTNLIPNASTELLDLLLCLANNCAVKDPRGQRWSKKVISVCLDLYTRSPQAYKSNKTVTYLYYHLQVLYFFTITT